MTVIRLPVDPRNVQDPARVLDDQIDACTKPATSTAEIFVFDGNRPTARRIQRPSRIAIACGGNQPELKARMVRQREERVPGVPALVKITYPSGRMVWVFRYYDPVTGKRNSLTLGTVTELPYIEAVARVKKMRDDIRDGRSPSAGRILVNEFVYGPFLDWAREFKVSWRDDESRYRLHLLEFIGHLHIDEVEKRDIKHAIDSLRVDNRLSRRNKLSTASINRIAMVARVIFRVAVEKGLRADNPADCLRNVREDNAKTRMLSPDEQIRLGRVLVNAPILLRCLIVFILSTSLRIDEALNVKFADVNRSRKEIYLPETKRGVAQKVPLAIQAERVINELQGIRRNEYLFPSAKGDGHMWAPYKALHALMAEAGIEDFTFHPLRRSWASEAITCDSVSSLDVSRVLRHQSIRTTERHYLVASEQRLLNAVNQAGALIHGRLEQGRALFLLLQPSVPSLEITRQMCFISARMV